MFSHSPTQQIYLGSFKNNDAWAPLCVCGGKAQGVLKACQVVLRCSQGWEPSLDITAAAEQVSYLNAPVQPFTNQFIPGRLEVRQGRCLDCNDTRRQTLVDPCLLDFWPWKHHHWCPVECVMTVTHLQTLGNWHMPGTAWVQWAWVRAIYRTPAQPAVFKKVWTEDAAK